MDDMAFKMYFKNVTVQVNNYALDLYVGYNLTTFYAQTQTFFKTSNKILTINIAYFPFL